MANSRQVRMGNPRWTAVRSGSGLVISLLTPLPSFERKSGPFVFTSPLWFSISLPHITNTLNRQTSPK